MQAELQYLYAQVSELQKQTTGLTVNAYRAYTDQQFNRAATQAIYAQMDNTTAFPVPTIPFVRDLGQPPMSVAQRANYSTLANAVMVANAHMLYTANLSGTLTATDFNVSYMCDGDFLVNNTIPGVDFDTLTLFLGPADNTSGATYPQYFPYGVNLTSTVWQCQCIYIITRTTCVLNTQSGTDVFPFTWDSNNATTSLANDPLMPSRCSGGTVQTQILDPTNTNPATVSFVTDIETFNSVLQNLCLTIPSTFIPAPTTGYLGRFSSDILSYVTNRYLNVNSNTTTLNDACNPGFATLRVLNALLTYEFSIGIMHYVLVIVY